MMASIDSGIRSFPIANEERSRYIEKLNKHVSKQTYFGKHCTRWRQGTWRTVPKSTHGVRIKNLWAYVDTWPGWRTVSMNVDGYYEVSICISRTRVWLLKFRRSYLDHDSPNHVKYQRERNPKYHMIVNEENSTLKWVTGPLDTCHKLPVTVLFLYTIGK